MTTAKFQAYSIRATYTGSKSAEWGIDNWNHHYVTVINTETHKRLRFDFWASLASCEIREASEVLEAFECFLSDAISGAMTFEEFCSEFGYDEDSRKAEQTWRLCKAAAVKAARVISGDIYDTANALRAVTQA